MHPTVVNPGPDNILKLLLKIKISFCTVGPYSCHDLS